MDPQTGNQKEMLSVLRQCQELQSTCGLPVAWGYGRCCQVRHGFFARGAIKDLVGGLPKEEASNENVLRVSQTYPWWPLNHRFVKGYFREWHVDRGSSP